MKNTIIISIITASMLGCNSDKSVSGNKKESTKDLKKQVEYHLNFDTSGYSLSVIEDLHERLTFKNYDKSLVDYVNTNPNKVDTVKKVVYLLPFGNMKPEILKLLQTEADYLKAFLQLEVKVLKRIPFDSIRKITTIKTRMVPRSDYEYYSKKKDEAYNLTEQIEANSFMNAVMKNNKPNDAIAVLGITEHDIYRPNSNFLFGISELKNGIGLVSTFRLIDYGKTTKYNIRKVVSKQIVNMFSIPNVKDFVCVMNYHESFEELIYGKFDLSPRALEKLKYATGLDYSKRFKELARFWANENNAEEEKYHSECLRRMKQATKSVKK